VDQRDGVVVAGELVVVQLVVLGIGQMKAGMRRRLESVDLLLQRNELIAFFGIAGNGDAADGELAAQLRLNGSSDDVVAEDSLGLLRRLMGLGTAPFSFSIRDTIPLGHSGIEELRDQ
jgi:hypothetical protein